MEQDSIKNYTSSDNHRGKYIMSPDSTEKLEKRAVILQTTSMKKKSTAVEKVSKNNKTKRKKLSRNDEEAFQDCQQQPNTFTHGMVTPFPQDVQNQERIRVRSVQELCSSEQSTPLILPAPRQMDNFTSFQPTQMYTTQMLNSTSNASSNIPSSSQVLPSMQANVYSNSLGPSTMEQAINTAISSLMPNTNNINTNSDTYLVNLLHGIAISIKSLNVFYKGISTLKRNLAQNYFFEIIIKLKRLFERLATYENQALSKTFIDYIMQKFRYLTKFELSLSSYEIDRILTYQPRDLRRWSNQSMMSSTLMSPSISVNPFRQATPPSTTLQTKNFHQISNHHESMIAKKKLFTDLQFLVFKQQVESCNYMTLWLNNKLSEEKRLKNRELEQMKWYSITTSEDNNVSSSTRDTVLVMKSRDSSSVGSVDETRCQLENRKKTDEQKEVEAFNHNSNANLMNVCENNSSQKNIVPIVQVDSVMNLKEEKQEEDSPVDNSSENTISVTKVMKLIENEENSTIEDVSVSVNSVETSVLRKPIHSHPIETLEHEISRNDHPIATDTTQTHKITSNSMTLSIEPHKESHATDTSLVDSSDNRLIMPISEKSRAVIKEDISDLDEDAESTIDQDEYYVEDSKQNSVKFYNQNPLETEVPAILLVQSITCDEFNDLSQSTRVNDCDDSDSDASSCTIVQIPQNECLLCNDESLFVCEFCKEAPYCSKMCQETHWEIVHHKTCQVREECDDIIVINPI